VRALMNQINAAGVRKRADEAAVDEASKLQVQAARIREAKQHNALQQFLL